jgi:hypothetical protein
MMSRGLYLIAGTLRDRSGVLLRVLIGLFHPLTPRCTGFALPLRVRHSGAARRRTMPAVPKLRD